MLTLRFSYVHFPFLLSQSMGTWDVGPFDNHAACDLLAAIRDGSFDFERFKRMCAAPPLDVDEAEVVIALGMLAKTSPEHLPQGISAESINALYKPQSRAWLRKQINATLDPDTSSVYALWEPTGELETWIMAVRAALP
ncbi:hypothetical protein WM42_2614 [Corynebacterium simulans]|nr:hypothetical protein WM42_2614 [Corynebacterium simulans]